jgi:hypothetical protein
MPSCATYLAFFQSFLDSFLVATRTLRQRQVRIGEDSIFELVAQDAILRHLSGFLPNDRISPQQMSSDSGFGK